MYKRIAIACFLVVAFLMPIQALAAGAHVVEVAKGNIPVGATEQENGSSLTAKIDRSLAVNQAGNFVDVTLDVDIVTTQPSTTQPVTTQPSTTQPMPAKISASSAPKTFDGRFGLALLTIPVLVAAGIVLCMSKKRVWTKGTSVLVVVALVASVGFVALPRNAQGAQNSKAGVVTETFAEGVQKNFTFDSIVSSTGGAHVVETNGKVTGLTWDVAEGSHNRITYRLTPEADIDDAWRNKEIPITTISRLDYTGLDGGQRNLVFPYISVLLDEGEQPTVDPYELIVEHYWWDGTTATPIGDPHEYGDMVVGSTYQASDYVLSDPTYTYLDHEIQDANGLWFAHSEQTSVTIEPDQHLYRLKLYYGKPATFMVSAKHPEYAVSLGDENTSPNYANVKSVSDVTTVSYLTGYHQDIFSSPVKLTPLTTPFPVVRGTVFESLLGTQQGYFVGQTVDIEDFISIPDGIGDPEDVWSGYTPFNNPSDGRRYHTSANVWNFFPIEPGQEYKHVLTNSANSLYVLYQENAWGNPKPPPVAE